MSAEQDDVVVLKQSNRGQQRPQRFSSIKNIDGLVEEDEEVVKQEKDHDHDDASDMTSNNNNNKSHHHHHQTQQQQQHPGRGLTKYRSFLGASSRRSIFGMLLRIEDNEDDLLSDGELDGFEDPSDAFLGYNDTAEDNMTNAGSVGSSLDGRRIFLLETKKNWSSQYSQFSQSTFEESLQLAMSQAPDEMEEDNDDDDDDQSLDPSAIASLKSGTYTTTKFHSSYQSFDRSFASSAISSKITEATPASKFHSSFASSSAGGPAAMGRQVSFGDVIINEHLIVVGDNPGGCGGVPVSLGWEPLQQHKLSLDLFEAARDGHRRPFPRLRMTKDHREKVLRELGFSRSERMVGVRVANIVREQRRRTNGMVNQDQLHEKMEKIKRKLCTVLTLGRIKARERAYIDSLKETVVVKVGKDGKAKTKTVWKPATGSMELDSSSTLNTSMNSSMFSLSWHNSKSRLSSSWQNSWRNSKSRLDNNSSFPANSLSLHDKFTVDS